MVRGCLMESRGLLREAVFACTGKAKPNDVPRHGIAYFESVRERVVRDLEEVHPSMK